MTAYIAFDKYIVEEETPYGTGVPLSFDEETAARESSRRKNVASWNRWLKVDVPGRESLLRMDEPLAGQSPEVFAALQKRNFLLTLFVTEGKKLYECMDGLIEGEDRKAESDRLFGEFCAEKLDFLASLPSGLDVLAFVNRKCRTHDMAKSSALLYSAGVKGALFGDASGERILLYNAAKDITVVEPRQGRLRGAAAL